MNDRTAFRSTAALTVALVLVALLVLVVLDPGRFRSVLNLGPASAPAASGDDDSAAGPRNTPPPTSKGTTIDPAQPFAGSPAAGYPAGIAGLRLPAAKPAGAFSAKEVAQTLDLARRYFAASRLDPEAVAGQYPAGVFALLDPKGTQTLDALRQGLSRPTEQDDPTIYVTRLDPRQDALHGPVIKVSGTATVRTKAADELVVGIDALVVYALRRVDGPQEVTRVVLRVQQDFHTFHGMDTTPGTVWLGESRLQWSGIACVPDGYVHPQYPSERRDVAGPSGDDPYDARRPIERDAGCGGDVSRI